MGKVLMGRGAMAGVAEGVALVCPESLQGWAGIDDHTGIIIEHNHSQFGQCIKDRILVLPCSKGSNGWSCHFHSAALSGHRPAGWVLTRIDSRAGVAIAVVGAPAVADFEEDPCLCIRTGDRIRIDGDKGTVEILEEESK